MAHMGLTEAEWQVMECLWTSAPRTGREIIDALGKTTGWSRSTTLTLLRRLEDKGSVSLMVSSLAKKQTLSQEEIDKLYAILREMEEEHD